jgi:hypothetical protein
MNKCPTGVIVGVFCGARESIKFLYDGECLCDNAVSLHFLEIPHFTLVEEPNVFKNNVGDIYSAFPKLCIRIVSKTNYVAIYTMFLS